MSIKPRNNNITKRIALLKLNHARKNILEIKAKNEALVKKRKEELLKLRKKKETIEAKKKAIGQKLPSKKLDPNKPYTWPKAPVAPIIKSQATKITASLKKADKKQVGAAGTIFPQVPTHKIKLGPKGRGRGA